MWTELAVLFFGSTGGQVDSCPTKDWLNFALHATLPGAIIL